MPIFLLTGCSIFPKEDKQTFSNRIVEIERSYDEIKDYELKLSTCFDVELDDYYLYFYSETCSHCSEIKNLMITEAIERGDIYFIKASNNDKLTNDQSLLIGAENPDDIYILGYPSLLEISNKKCIKNEAGKSNIQAVLNKT